jgi:hypothetical protein
MKASFAVLLFIGAISANQSSVENLVALQGDGGIIDALTPAKGACEERLWISQDEMDWQMDQFSRKFDIKNY